MRQRKVYPPFHWKRSVYLCPSLRLPLQHWQRVFSQKCPTRWLTTTTARASSPKCPASTSLPGRLAHEWPNSQNRCTLSWLWKVYCFCLFSCWFVFPLCMRGPTGLHVWSNCIIQSICMERRKTHKRTTKLASLQMSMSIWETIDEGMYGKPQFIFIRVKILQNFVRFVYCKAFWITANELATCI